LSARVFFAIQFKQRALSIKYILIKRTWINRGGKRALRACEIWYSV